MEQVLYMHTGSGNHGCEAIVRMTAELLGKEKTLLWSLSKNEDIQYGVVNKVARIIESEEIARFSPAYFEALVRRKILKQEDGMMQVFLKKTFQNRIAVSIGGDNYCYPWSAKQAVQLDAQIRRWCKATVLWGCSIDPEAITPEVKEDLQRFDLITARESLTYELLKTINPNTKLVADPAFLMETKEIKLPKIFLSGNTVGINVSPLIMQYGVDGNLILDNYIEMIQMILNETDMNICLVPHVVWSYNNDLEPIRVLFEKFRDTGRICLIEDGSAPELKSVISQCRFFVGARTHATIAAYSTGVPTLVVGYSTKSRGIARDLFGTEENYVLHIQNLKTRKDLSEHFEWIIKNESKIKNHLLNVMPDYKNKAKQASKLFEDLL